MAKLSGDVRARAEAALFWSVATVNEDGSPHVSPMWIGVEGEHLMFNTSIGRVKEENLRRDPRVSLYCTDPGNPYDRLVIQARAVAFVEGEEAGRSMDRLARKYLDMERYEWLVPGERRVMVLLEPLRVRHVVGVEPFRPGTLPPEVIDQ